MVSQGSQESGGGGHSPGSIPPQCGNDRVAHTGQGQLMQPQGQPPVPSQGQPPDQQRGPGRGNGQEELGRMENIVTVFPDRAC